MHLAQSCSMTYRQVSSLLVCFGKTNSTEKLTCFLYSNRKMVPVNIVQPEKRRNHCDINGYVVFYCAKNAYYFTSLFVLKPNLIIEMAFSVVFAVR